MQGSFLAIDCVSTITSTADQQTMPSTTHPPIKAILFDLDDTLWHLAPTLVRAEAILYDWLNVHIPGVTRRFSNEELRELRMELLPTDPQFQFNVWALRHAALTRACHLTSENKDLVDQAMAVFSVARNAVQPFEDVVPGLRELSTRFALGSVSNGFADLGEIGLAPYFQTSIAAHQFGSAKPGAEIFHAACAALAVAPEQAIYVGDDPKLDIQGAQNAGLRAVWMNRLDRVLPAEIVPDASVHNLYELDAWLKRA
ncbi:Flavin mononucleotide phosphatase YigB [compost metagenome]